VRVLACLFLIGIGLGLIGCSSFGKKAPTAQESPPNRIPAGVNQGASQGTGAVPYGDRATSAGVNGVLAGRVLDSYDHVPPPTYIRAIRADTRGQKGEPLEVATDAQGFFMIRDLQPGQHYQLIARTRDGQPRLAGTTWAVPPNPRVLIYISQDLATENTPPPPGPPAMPGQKNSGPGGQSSDTGSSDSGKEQNKPSTSSISPQGTAELGPPMRVDENQPNRPEPRMEVRPQDTARSDQDVARGSLPAQISPQFAEPSVTSGGTGGGGLPSLATRVPSCVLTGRQLENFALYDLDGKTWEYRTNRRGKLVLLDFWGTWCIPCVQAVHHLRILQSNYGRAGLEVVGIDYERDGTPGQQVRRVQNLRNALSINYCLLLGSDIYTCPVKTQFGVRNFPTLVLLDENNRIIWRSEGLGMNAEKLPELELLIKQHLLPQ
jgi:thiol-disulfide isomerase/thioredoxin